MGNVTIQKPGIPMCTNIIRLQSYKLQPDEMVFFDWLLMKFESFNYKPFYYSQQRVEKETRITRRRFEAIISKFSTQGFLKTRVLVDPVDHIRKRFYRIVYHVLESKLSEIITEPLLPDFISYIQFCESEQARNLTKKAKKQEAKKTQSNDNWLSSLFEMLNNTYRNRVELYNKGELTSEIPNRTKCYAPITTNKTTKKRLLRIKDDGYTEDDINNAFLAYSDYYLKDGKDSNGERIGNMMGHFLTYDDAEDYFPIFSKYLDEYKNYGHENS